MRYLPDAITALAEPEHDAFIAQDAVVGHFTARLRHCGFRYSPFRDWREKTHPLNLPWYCSSSSACKIRSTFSSTFPRWSQRRLGSFFHSGCRANPAAHQLTHASRLVGRKPRTTAQAFGISSLPVAGSRNLREGGCSGYSLHSNRAWKTSS